MLTGHISPPSAIAWGAPFGAAHDTHIDGSLAGSIRRTYFRELGAQWKRLDQANARAKGRNQSITRRSDTNKQLRERFQQLEKMVGPLIPCASAYVNANSRGAAFILGLLPDPIPAQPKADCQASVMAMTLLRPGGLLPLRVRVKVSGHAVDRVIQRAQMVDLPVSDLDIQAINAEFADALPLACIAADILVELKNTEGERAAEETQVLLPAPHGVFLGNWSSADQVLIVRTFVDGAKLTAPQQQALREISGWADGELSTQVLNTLTHGWMNVDVSGLKTRLLETWRHYGWRFDEQRLHPGLSDRAWAGTH